MGLPSPKRSKSVEDVVFDPNKKIYKIAVISDLHFGSRWANVDFLNTFIDDCKSQGITTLLNCGDLTDGIDLWNGQEKEVLLHSEYSYEEYTEDHYPRGFAKSIFIIGNHDSSIDSLIGHGYSFGNELVKRRKDLTYLPAEDKMTKSVTLKGGLTVNLYHGNRSCSNTYGENREQKLQSKILGFMACGIDADLFCLGHCHKIHQTVFMGKHILGLGCFQNTTPYLKSRGSKNDVCGMILRYQKDDNDKFIIHPEFKWEKDYISDKL